MFFPILLYIFSKKYKWSNWKERLFGNIKPIQVYYKDDNTPFFLYEKKQPFELFNLLNLPEQPYYSKGDSWEESWNEQSSWEESMKEFLE